MLTYIKSIEANMITEITDYTGDVWIVAEIFVCEPGIEGMQIGQLPDFDLSKCRVVKRLTQAEYDSMCEDFYEENGYYPGQ